MQARTVQLTLAWTDARGRQTEVVSVDGATRVEGLCATLRQSLGFPFYLVTGGRRERCYSAWMSDWADGINILTARMECVRLPDDTPTTRLRYLDEVVWEGLLPDDARRDVLWEQLRACHPGLPEVTDIDFQDEPDDWIRAIPRFASVARIPNYPPATPPILYLVPDQASVMGMMGAPCPRCGVSIMDAETGGCLGRTEYRINLDGTRSLAELPCPHPAVVDSDPVEAERQGARRSGQRYTPFGHVADVFRAVNAEQQGEIPVGLIYYLAMIFRALGRQPDRHSVFGYLTWLNRCQPGAFHRYYPDAARIALILQRDPRDQPDEYFETPPRQGVPSLGTPGAIVDEVREICAEATRIWRHSPPALRRGRRNFLRAPFNIWMALGILARRHQDTRYLDARAVVAGPRGERPGLCDSRREAEFVSIWADIAREAGWGEIIP